MGKAGSGFGGKGVVDVFGEKTAEVAEALRRPEDGVFRALVRFIDDRDILGELHLTFTDMIFTAGDDGHGKECTRIGGDVLLVHRSVKPSWRTYLPA